MKINQTATKTLAGVNLFKFVFAVSIILMHTAVIGNHTWTMKLICRLAVPYFFVASGFFLYSKCVSDCDKAVAAYLKRLLLPYVFFSAVWILQMIVDESMNGANWNQIAHSVVQHILFFPRGALWYVWASMIGVLLLYPFLKRGGLNAALVLGILFFALGELGNNYYFVACRLKECGVQRIVDEYLRICLTTNNGLFIGFVYLTIGMLLKKHFPSFPRYFCWGVAIIALLFYILEIRYVWKQDSRNGDEAFYFSQLLLVPAVFLVTAKTPFKWLSPSLSSLLKNLSTGIYFLHVPLLWIINRGAKYVLPHIPLLHRVAGVFDRSLVKFSVCFVSSVFICLLAYRHDSAFSKVLK